MRLIHVDPKKIRIPSVRVTSVWDPEEYETFKASLEADGQAQAIICVKEENTFWLADGQHRLEEALINSWPKIAVAYKEGTLIDAKCRNLYMNRLRGKTKASEEVTLIKDLYENHSLNIAEIEQRTGISQELIEKRMAIAKADPYVLECLDNERIGVTIAFELARLPNARGQIKLLQEILKYPRNPPVKWVREVVEDSLEIIAKMARGEQAPGPTIPLRTITCHLCGQKHEESEVRGFNIDITCAGLAKDYIQELMRKRAKEGTPEQALAAKIAKETAEEGSPP